jgi:hypothetical protein
MNLTYTLYEVKVVRANGQVSIVANNLTDYAQAIAVMAKWLETVNESGDEILIKATKRSHADRIKESIREANRKMGEIAYRHPLKLVKD